MVTDHATAKGLTVRQAAFIGVGAMVGAGIFSLLGAAGEVRYLPTGDASCEPKPGEDGVVSLYPLKEFETGIVLVALTSFNAVLGL